MDDNIENIEENDYEQHLSLLVLSLIWNLFYSKSSGAHLFGALKLLEFTFLGIYALFEFQKRDIRGFITVLSLSAVISSTLSIWQFLNQSSVGGLWYFFGERTFNISTIGISTVNLDHLVLRPYAAFPHPNVLAFFLLTAIIFIVPRISYEKRSVVKMFLILTILLSTVGLFLTFARVAILLTIAFLLYEIYANLKSKRFAITLTVILGILSIFVFSNIFRAEFLLRGVDFREELLFQSYEVFLSSPYFGVGINNFFVHQVDLVKNISPILFQPPHNIFVLALLQLGLFGWWIFPAIFFFAIRSLIKKLKAKSQELKAFYTSVLFILIAIIIVGMFDHFFLTLEQGQIVLALILGLSFAKLKN